MGEREPKTQRLFENDEDEDFDEENSDDDENGGGESPATYTDYPDLVLMDDVENDLMSGDPLRGDSLTVEDSDGSPFRGLARRLEPFATLAQPLDTSDEAQVRGRLGALHQYREMHEHESQDRAAVSRDVGSGLLVCRICRDSDSGLGFGSEAGISPCNCRGSVACVHLSCLERWLAESDTNCCELCGHQYTIVRTPRYNVMTSIPAWLCSSGHPDLLFDLVAFCAFTPVALLGTYVGINSDDGAYLQVLLMACVDLMYSAWLAMRLQFHVACWYSWWRRKSSVKIILQDSVLRTETIGVSGNQVSEVADTEPEKNLTLTGSKILDIVAE